MRENKFRAWDEGNKIMHHNFQFIRTGLEGNDWIVFSSDEHPLDMNPHPFENPYFSQQLKVMQFTGLHDKNGKEIYEGDFIKQSDGQIAKITFEPFAFCAYKIPLGAFADSWSKIIEVVGNIYENPELLRS